MVDNITGHQPRPWTSVLVVDDRGGRGWLSFATPCLCLGGEYCPENTPPSCILRRGQKGQRVCARRCGRMRGGEGSEPREIRHTQTWPLFRSPNTGIRGRAGRKLRHEKGQLERTGKDIPRLHTSASWLYSGETMISGARYQRVVTYIVCVGFSTSSVRANPKSRILIRQSSHTAMLLGLRSRCMMCAEWRYFNPTRIWYTKKQMCSSSMAWQASTSHNVEGASSITKYTLVNDCGDLVRMRNRELQ